MNTMLQIIAQAGPSKAKYKRQYINIGKDKILPPVENEINIKDYKNFIINLLYERGKVLKSEGESYTSDNFLKLFIRSVTHDSVDPLNKSNNYEMMEHFGDSTVNKIATWYLKSKFPDIVNKGNEGVQILSKQKSLIVSKPYLANYCNYLKLDKFIRYRPLDFEYVKEPSEQTKLANIKIQSKQIKRISLDNSMKEDVFESFFGCLEDVIDSKEGYVGIGYSVCFRILSSLYDEQKIPHTKNELVDPKTQLKEIFDKRRKYGDSIVYPVDNTKKEVHLEIHFGNEHGDGKNTIGKNKQGKNLKFGPESTVIPVIHELGYDVETNKKIIEQKLARIALTYLQKEYGNEFKRYADNE